MKRNLIEMSKKYETDKNPFGHNYVQFYSSIFDALQDEKLNLVEIGIGKKGGSAKLWDNFFVNSNIFILDYDPKIISRLSEVSKKVKPILVDQSKEDSLDGFATQYGPFDIIIDDGSHLFHHQKLSWERLWPHVKSNGWYIIEDVHFSYRDRYQHGSGQSISDYFSTFIKEINWRGQTKFANYRYYDNPKQGKVLTPTFHQKTIKSISFLPGIIALNKSEI